MKHLLHVIILFVFMGVTADLGRLGLGTLVLYGSDVLMLR
jgi:hypothetical protein